MSSLMLEEAQSAAQAVAAQQGYADQHLSKLASLLARQPPQLALTVARGSSDHAYIKADNFSQPMILKYTQPREIVLTIQMVPFDSTRKLLLSRDITQLEMVQTVHRDFVANVSHELRTPLTVIGGFLETLNDMTGHQDIAPGRKTDPGPYFDWPRLKQGVSVNGGSE